MNEETWIILEYENLRQELNDRIRMLHNTINLAILALLIFTIMTFVFISLGIKKELLITFLLLIPVIIDLLGYNYQSNQNSLESIPKYFFEQIKPKMEKKFKTEILGWEKYFAIQKKPFMIESSTKIFPFLFPSFIPIYFLFFKIPLVKYQSMLAITDLILLVLMIENFRYKLRRVK